VTDHDAFVAAIVNAPDDATARLVYADWLEERGDPRAEFLRLAVDLRRGEVRVSPHMFCCPAEWPSVGLGEVFRVGRK